MNVRLDEFIKEDRVIEGLHVPENRLIMVMGGSDTGKTTLIECIADLLSRPGSVGVVDLDMGQSHIGLPTTVAWGRVEGGFKGWAGIREEDFYFTGTLSPPKSLIPVLTGAKLITERAVSSCTKVVVDTTGLISGPVGRVLKQFKVDLLSPDIILTLERSGELGHIVDAFRFQRGPRVYRLSVPVQVRTKSPDSRVRYRIESFKSYFSGAQQVELPLNKVGIRFTMGPAILSNIELKDRVVSFRDINNKDIALGIIKKVDIRGRKIVVLSPVDMNVGVSTLVVGGAEVAL